MSSPNNKLSSFPSDEQRQVLQTLFRVTIVKAAPGSGKTSVFIEFLKQNLSSFESRFSGIAALSFTNAAQEEISNRLGRPIDNQHFIGTLDSFLFRFVVKPFAHCVGASINGVDLLAAPLDENLSAPTVSYGKQPQQKVCVFAVNFSSGDLQSPRLLAKANYQKIDFGQTYTADAIKIKENLWKNRGLITHSDCHFLAAKILSNPQVGPSVIKLLAKRFPLILVDEFQDTGRFLSIALKQILENENIRSLVVGDPDQAIFEFSGATPHIFSDLEKLPGAKILPITESRRCSNGICEIAKNLSDTKTPLVSASSSSNGRHIIFVHRYDSDVRLETNLINILKSLPNNGGEVAFLSRTNPVLKQLKGDFTDFDFQGTSSAGKSISKAVGVLKTGEALQAYKIMSTRMTLLFYEAERLSPRELEAKGIDYLTWKKQIYALLVELSKDVPGETWNDWLIRAKSATIAVAKYFGVTRDKEISDKFRRHKDGDVVKELVKPSPPPVDEVLARATYKTIHDAKGTEYDTAVIFYKKPHNKNSPCISSTWFNLAGSTEEKRVGFVALTRAKQNIILCIHSKTFSELQKSQKDFVSKFEIIQA